MQSSFYVALSAQISHQRRLDSIANNLANSATFGFRAEAVKFESILSRTGPEPVAFSSTGATYLSRRAGEIVETGNQLDIAVEGNSWLAFQSPGGPVYTRDGRLQMTQTGELQSLTGYPMLDAGGAPLQLDPGAGPPQIARDGTITQGGRQVGAIGLFQIDENAKLTRFENSGVIPDIGAQPALDFSRTGVVQGYLERANVNPVAEITRMIMLQRTFDALTASINETQSTLSDAIRTLGSGG